MPGATRLKQARFVLPGDVILLPFEQTATVTEVSIGRRYVTFKYQEYPKSRVELDHEVQVVVPD